MYHSYQFILHLRKFCVWSREHYIKYEFKASNFSRHYNCVIKYIVVKTNTLLQFFSSWRAKYKRYILKKIFQMTHILNKEKLIACKKVKECKIIAFADNKSTWCIWELVYILYTLWGFPGGSVVKNLPALQETWVLWMSWEDSLRGK